MLISAKGPINNSYSKKETYEHSSESEIVNLIENTENILWIRTGFSEYFVNIFKKDFQKRKIYIEVNKDLDILANNLYKLKKPVILITSDGDRNVPSSYSIDTVNNILNNKNIRVWYTQNYDKTILHPKLKHFPIGFCLHAFFVKNEDKMSFSYNYRLKFLKEQKINNKIFSDCKAHLTNSRIKLVEKIKNNPNIIFSEGRKSYEEITQLYNKYLFVLSPSGHGMDCYRTWELFLAGAIVITKTSSLDDMYINNNLPVVLLKDWDELNYDLETKLTMWYNEHYHKTSLENIYPKLHVNYWLKDYI